MEQKVCSFSVYKTVLLGVLTLDFANSLYPSGTVVNFTRFSRFLFQPFHHRKEKFSYNRETERFIPCDI